VLELDRLSQVFVWLTRSLGRPTGKKPRDYARKKDMRELYAKAERGELDLDTTTERTAAALVQRYTLLPLTSSDR
jgi:hypothetical protein